MTQTTSGPLSVGDQGLVTVSRGAGRLLFALLLSVGPATELSRLANIPSKSLQVCIDELIAAEVQVPDPVEDMTTPVGSGASELTQSKPLDESIPQRGHHVPQQQYLVDPESELEAACMTADQIEDPVKRLRAQAEAVVEAWRLFFPRLTKAEEIVKRQDLAPRKAREWINLVSEKFPGKEARTVFGWLGGVEEGYLLSMQFPLAYVNKMIQNKSQEAQAKPEPEDDGGDEEVMDRMRQYMKKQIEQGGTNGNQNSEGHLFRIVQAVQGSGSQPS